MYFPVIADSPTTVPDRVDLALVSGSTYGPQTRMGGWMMTVEVARADELFEGLGGVSAVTRALNRTAARSSVAMCMG
jgi:hypothetical protein